MATAAEKEFGELFSRGVASFIDPDGSFIKKLKDNPKRIVIKLGVDPTRPDIHLGHAIVLRKLRQFQDLGCKVIFLVGDYTAQIGDPSGKNKVRPDIDQAEVDKNAKTYIDQVGKILRTEEAVFSWIRNSDWFYAATDLMPDPSVRSIDLEIKKSDSSKEKIALSPDSFLGKSLFFESTRMQRTHLMRSQIISVTLRGLLWTLKHITHSRLIERDMFAERIKKGEELYMHEMLYPVLQGVDSFALASIYGSCDLEVGGTDQTFNMLMGRDVMKANSLTPQAVLSFEILEGLDGKEKMSKSLDNYVAITDTPQDMFGKIMSLPDFLIGRYFELCTYSSIEDVEKVKKELSSSKTNPKDLKARLAKEIVEIYHGPNKAIDAERNFTQTFSKGVVPTDVSEIPAKPSETLGEILIRTKLVSSKTEFRRLVESRAIEYLEMKLTIDSNEFIPTESGTFRVGKKRFIKILI